MNTQMLLSHLQKQGVVLWVEQDRLRYSAPAGVMTTSLRAELASQKPEIIELLRNPADITYIPPPLVKVPHVATPLSFAQQRMWFLNQLAPNSPFYNAPATLYLSGRLNVAALEQTLREVLRRHEALRTTIAVIDGSPLQSITPPSALQGFVLPLIDMHLLAAHKQETEVQRLLEQETLLPFDLSQDLMLRARLIRRGDDEHIFLFTIHHIASDGWSLGLLQHEFSILYNAFVEGRPSPLPELSIQYADFASWQRQWLQGDILEHHLSYWRKQLANIPTVHFPTDFQRPAIQTFHGARYPIQISPVVFAQLKALSQQQGVMLFMTLLAAFYVLLMGYSGQEDIVIGSAIANRIHAEIEGLIGFFANILALRVHITSSQSFRDLLQHVRDVALEAYVHQDLPFERLVEELAPERTLTYNPLCQIVFQLLNTHPQPLKLSGLKLQTARAEMGTSRFDLVLSLYEGADSVSGTWDYNTDLFTTETIAYLNKHFQVLLENIVADPDQPIINLPLLDFQERAQLLEHWNVSGAAPLQYACLHQIVEAQANRRPDTVALVCDDEQMTYALLDKRANQLAHYLREKGIGPDVPVGICIERSLELIIGVLGILKAGGAYVPLDSTYPTERLSFMLTDAQIPLLLTQRRLYQRFSQENEAIKEQDPSSQIAIVCLDEEIKQISHRPNRRVEQRVTPDHLAYISYTSGSTGKPKGVLIQHRCIIGFLFGVDYFHFGPEQIMLQYSSISWDAFTMELWSTLLHGGRCVLYTGDVLDLLLLGRTIQTQGVTMLGAAPSFFSTLLEAAPEMLTTIRQQLLGGEVFPTSLARRCQERFPDMQLVNGYGPSEATVLATCHSVPSPLPSHTSTIPIGRPIGDREIYILDPHLHPVPVGIAGEVYIGGPAVGRGYQNLPMLTAERFLPHPFSQRSGDRVYKTGDYARYRPDGTIEFLSRLDTQVKLRGIRIEPNEIEVVLNQYPAIQSSVVTLQENNVDEKRLIAYLILKRGKQDDFNSRHLREYLRVHMPEYMIPAIFLPITALPLTSNGKVDYKALPVPDWNEQFHNADDPYVAPRTPLELRLTTLWSQLLKVERVGIHDDFFVLGGHSLLATQIISRLREDFRVELSLRQIFEYPTIDQLAQHIERVKGQLQLPTLEKPALVPRERSLHRVRLTKQQSDTTPHH